jgi:SSS family solute:Na+ symporter
MVAGLLAAYVSTLITHLNWGTSYLVHDLYRRFLKPGRTEKHYVLVGRLVTVGLMILAALFTFVLDSARQAFNLMLSVGAGTGLIYLLRWFWWRINGWSEIAAMASSFLAALGFFVAGKMGLGLPAHISLILTVAITTVVWGLTTFLTKPVERSKLHEFCRLVRPAGPGWRAVRAEAGVDDEPGYLTQALLGWITGCLFVYSALFGAGSFLYGKTVAGCVWSVLFLVAGFFLRRIFRRLWTPAAQQVQPKVY